eukprot:6190304-Pleurochrysis_carterae.AAC.1
MCSTYVLLVQSEHSVYAHGTRLFRRRSAARVHPAGGAGQGVMSGRAATSDAEAAQRGSDAVARFEGVETEPRTSMLSEQTQLCQSASTASQVAAGPKHGDARASDQGAVHSVSVPSRFGSTVASVSSTSLASSSRGEGLANARCDTPYELPVLTLLQQGAKTSKCCASYWQRNQRWAKGNMHASTQ